MDDVLASTKDRLRRRAFTRADFALPENSGGLSRQLGVYQLTFLGLGSVVGAGIYVLVGFTARTVAGPGIVIGFLVAGIAAMLSALSYAEFSCETRTTGGAFAYTSAVFGEMIAWLCGWSMCLGSTLSSSAVARGMSAYLAAIISISPEKMTIQISPSVVLEPIGFALIFFLTIILIVGIKESARFGLIICCINIACILLVIVSGLTVSSISNLEPFLPYGVSGVFSASSILFFAYAGFDYVVNAAEEAQDPGRDLPRSILGSLTIASLLYMGMSVTIVLMMPYDSIDISAPFSAAFISHGKHIVANIVSIGALSGITTSTMMGLLSQARLLTVLGRERFLPYSLSSVNMKTHTPILATSITGLIAGCLAFFVDISSLAELVSAGTLCVFFFVNAGLLVKRTTECTADGDSFRFRTVAISCICTTPILTIVAMRMSLSWIFQVATILPWVVSCIILQTKCIKVDPTNKSTYQVPFFPWASASGVLSVGLLFWSLQLGTLVQFFGFMMVGICIYIFYGSVQIDKMHKEGPRYLELSQPN